MYDELTLGPCPVREEAVQVTRDGGYWDAMRAQCRRYRDFLQRLFPIPEGASARFTVRSYPHDYGTYCEAVIRFDADDEEAVRFAYFVEAHLPQTWDEPALVDSDMTQA